MAPIYVPPPARPWWLNMPIWAIPLWIAAWVLAALVGAGTIAIAIRVFFVLVQTIGQAIASWL